MGFVVVSGNIAIATALPRSSFVHCIVNIKQFKEFIYLIFYKIKKKLSDPIHPHLANFIQYTRTLTLSSNTPAPSHPDAVGPVEVVPAKGMPPDKACLEIENVEILTMEMATVEVVAVEIAAVEPASLERLPDAVGAVEVPHLK